MITKCLDCKREYNDATRSTICPHKQLLPDGDMARKDYSITILSQEVSFKHQPNGPYHKVVSINFEGMVGLNDLEGWFSPDLFDVRKI